MTLTPLPELRVLILAAGAALVLILAVLLIVVRPLLRTLTLTRTLSELLIIRAVALTLSTGPSLTLRLSELLVLVVVGPLLRALALTPLPELRALILATGAALTLRLAVLLIVIPLVGVLPAVLRPLLRRLPGGLARATILAGLSTRSLTELARLPGFTVLVRIVVVLIRLTALLPAVLRLSLAAGLRRLTAVLGLSAVLRTILAAALPLTGAFVV